MATELQQMIDVLAKDKGIEKSVLIATLEDAMGTAAKKHFGQERNLEAKYDAEKGVVELFQAITVVQDGNHETTGAPQHAGGTDLEQPQACARPVDNTRCARSTALTRLLRLGFHTLVELPDGSRVATVHKRVVIQR